MLKASTSSKARSLIVIDSFEQFEQESSFGTQIGHSFYKQLRYLILAEQNHYPFFP
jgi:hypothetical protein